MTTMFLLPDINVWLALAFGSHTHHSFVLLIAFSLRVLRAFAVQNGIARVREGEALSEPDCALARQEARPPRIVQGHLERHMSEHYATDTSRAVTGTFSFHR